MSYILAHYNTRFNLEDIRLVSDYYGKDDFRWFYIHLVGLPKTTTFDLLRQASDTDAQWAERCAQHRDAYDRLCEAWSTAKKTLETELPKADAFYFVLRGRLELPEEQEKAVVTGDNLRDLVRLAWAQALQLNP